MMPNNANVLVFGGAGFIGEHLLKSLKQRGTGQLTSVDIKDPLHPVEGVNYLKGDVRDLSAFSSNIRIDIIYNLAAIHTTPGYEEHEYYETNILGAEEINAFARRHNIEQIVFTSSISVYGPGEETKSESSRLSPSSAYGWSKYLAERIHKGWFEESETRKLVIVRPAVVFGPNEGGNFTRMAKLLKKGFFVYPGRDDTIKACFYVEDLIEAIDSAFADEQRLVIFNGCYPDRYTIKQIVYAFRQASFPKIKELMVPSWIVKMVAKALKPLSFLGLGIHPDRVTKLTRSTDIEPGWLLSKGLAKSRRLPEALMLWAKQNNYN